MPETSSKMQMYAMVKIDTIIFEIVGLFLSPPPMSMNLVAFSFKALLHCKIDNLIAVIKIYDINISQNFSCGNAVTTQFLMWERRSHAFRSTTPLT